MKNEGFLFKFKNSAKCKKNDRLFYTKSIKESAKYVIIAENNATLPRNIDNNSICYYNNVRRIIYFPAVRLIYATADIKTGKEDKPCRTFFMRTRLP